MKRSALIILVMLLIVSVIAVYAFNPTTAEENDPLINEDANACFVGGAWEGTCGDSDLLWNAGWYLIRFEQGVITRDQVPDQYKWILPKEASENEKPVIVPTNPPVPPL